MPPVAPPPAAAPPEGGVPRSSVGATFVVRRRPRVLAYLIEREGEAVGRVHQLDDDITDIGRDPRNHLVLGDVLVSGFHARIERGPDGSYLVQDRGSTNGSFLNDEPLRSPRPLQENDQLRVGNTTLVLKVIS
jgi:pSer/pThr/pTyr-binding forkhead associated (FHA) protein